MPFMDGALIIDKPANLTSHDVVAQVRRAIGERRVGHTGTLDPFATGVLVVLAGRATRLAQFLSGADKEYEAVIRLGCATDTGDVTGARLSETHAPERSPQSLCKEDIEGAILSLRGQIEQTPPMHSAKKVEGRKLYELARRGEEVERKPVKVTISEFETMPRAGTLLNENQDGTRDLAVRVVCSAGTYIRTLAEECGKRMGVAAHLAALRRTRAGRFTIKDAITLDRLTELAESNSMADVMISPDDALSHLPVVQLSNEEAQRASQGIDLRIENPTSSSWQDHQSVRMRDTNGSLIAVGKFVQSKGIIHPNVVISTE